MGLSYDRFEPDMLAFSGCDYGGGEKERQELGAIRSRWKSLHVRLHWYLINFHSTIIMYCLQYD